MLTQRQLSRWGIRAIVLIVVAAFLLRTVVVLAGIDELALDAKRWQEVGRTVLQGGAPYLDAPDNKPPLWLLIATVGEATGVYAGFMLSIVALSNVLIIIAVYSDVLDDYALVPALVSALVAAELLINATIYINNKSLAVALAVGVLLTSGTIRSGILAGLAASVAQHAGAVVPLVSIYQWYTGRWKLGNTFFFALVSVGVYALQYAVVGLIWGTDAFFAAIDQSVVSIFPYVSGGGQFPNNAVISNQPMYVLISRGRFVLEHLVVFGAAVIGTVWVVRHGDSSDRFWLAWALLFGAMLFLTSFAHYIALSTPGIAILAALAIVYLQQNLSFSHSES